MSDTGDAEPGTDTPIPRDGDGHPIDAPQADEPPPTAPEDREVTGEPVETDEGWVIPQQQNVGADQTATTATSEDDGAT